MKLLIVPLLPLALLGCDGVYQGEYKPGDGIALETQLPLTSAPDQRDTEFNTAVDSCVQDAVREEFGELFQPPLLQLELASFADKPPSSRAEFDDLADLLLREVVDGEGLVDYSALRETYAFQWKSLIDALRAGEIVKPPPGEEVAAAMSFWTNIYNLAVIDLVVKNEGVRVIDAPLQARWFGEKQRILGIDLSLNQIEKGILSLGGSPFPVDPELKVPVVEPRLHYTLVCGAISCPKLRNFYYRAYDFDRVLRENELMVANQTKFFEMFSGFLEVSALIVEFYPGDFQKLYGEDYSGVADRMIASCPDRSSDIPLIREALEAGDVDAKIYEWNVNDQSF